MPKIEVNQNLFFNLLGKKYNAKGERMIKRDERKSRMRDRDGEGERERALRMI